LLPDPELPFDPEVDPVLVPDEAPVLPVKVTNEPSSKKIVVPFAAEVDPLPVTPVVPVVTPVVPVVTPVVPVVPTDVPTVPVTDVEPLPSNDRAVVGARAAAATAMVDDTKNIFSFPMIFGMLPPVAPSSSKGGNLSTGRLFLGKFHFSLFTGAIPRVQFLQPHGQKSDERFPARREEAQPPAASSIRDQLFHRGLIAAHELVMRLAPH
jgi:hypothetical protein